MRDDKKYPYLSYNIPTFPYVVCWDSNFASSRQSKTQIRKDMNLFSFFKKSGLSDVNPEPATTRDDECIQSDTSTAQQPKGNVISITYGTGMPIDVIYGFIAHNYEQDGYQDALVNSSVEYCTAKENIILNELNQLFRRVLLRYRGEIRDIDVRIENAKSLFALTSASQLTAHKETCEEHISEINDMIEKVNIKAPEMMTMIESYRRGFTKGCAAQTANFLNPNRITA